MFRLFHPKTTGVASEEASSNNNSGLGPSKTSIGLRLKGYLVRLFRSRRSSNNRGESTPSPPPPIPACYLYEPRRSRCGPLPPPFVDHPLPARSPPYARLAKPPSPASPASPENAAKPPPTAISEDKVESEGLPGVVAHDGSASANTPGEDAEEREGEEEATSGVRRRSTRRVRFAL